VCGIGGVEIGLLAAERVEIGLETVGHQDFANPTEELEGVHMGFNPERQIYGGRGFCVNIVAGAKRCDESVGFDEFGGCGIDNRDGLSGKILEHLLAGPMFFA